MSDDSNLTKQANLGQIQTNKTKFGMKSGLQARLAAHNQTQSNVTINAASLPNRIGLMLDVSGSMQGDKLEHLKLAAESFLTQCNPADTSCAINTFEPSLRVPLSTNHLYTSMQVKQLTCLGSTPMAPAMEEMLMCEPLTRGVLVSDGQPDDIEGAYNQARNFKEAGIQIDTVHIGDATSGQECLQEIASITGGVYIKFTDIASFSKSFKYLTPGYRALLNAPTKELAQLLGATEIR